MKKLIILFLISFTVSVAQSQQLVWEHTVGTPDSAVLEYVTLPNGGFAALYSVGGFTTRLATFDSVGNPGWNHLFAPEYRTGGGNMPFLKPYLTDFWLACNSITPILTG